MEKVGKIIWNFLDHTAKIVVVWFLGLFKIKITDEQWDKFMQFVKFCVVGLSNFIISYVVYAAALALGLHWLAGSILGFVISVLNAFYWNNKYVFKQNEGQERNIFAALLKTYVSYAFTGLFLNSVLSFIWVEIIGVSKLIAPIINLLVSVPINFLMNKFWAFKTESK